MKIMIKKMKDKKNMNLPFNLGYIYKTDLWKGVHIGSKNKI